MKYLKRLWDEKPLSLIIFLAAFFRLLSVIFSKGYGMHDDHFLVIEAAQSWVDGFDYNNWLPNEKFPEQLPSGHSFFYTGLHYFLFSFLKMIGLNSPQGKMYIVRALHALVSLVTVYYGYKITEKVKDIKTAKVVGILLATYWLFPILSVRNLVEYVCIAPLMYATWLVIKNNDNKKILPIIYAGIFLGIAFSIRFQTVFFSMGFGLVFLFKKQFKEAFLVGVAFLLTGAATQGITDYFIWGRPFVEFSEYIRYNLANADTYFTQPTYMYLLFIAGILIPPLSLFLLYGFFRSWKKQLLLFLPAFIFLIFHMWFPNKQERFILPVLPFVIMLGYIGWTEYIEGSKFWLSRQKLQRGIWISFWIINIIPLCVVSLAYSKKNRVESMCYIAARGDVNLIVVEDSNRDDFLMPPLFYLQKWGHVFGITKLAPASVFYHDIYKSVDPKFKPNYVVFMQKENIVRRVAELKYYIPTLTYLETIEPSFIDWLLNWLNPHNKNQTSFVYKIE